MGAASLLIGKSPVEDVKYVKAMLDYRFPHLQHYSLLY